ncbi:MAG: helix-hairpin-helix domain-containing protein [Deltaproteobacteria bacterium]|jgi:uncharacterized protein|nr:helix-hairpin-helix domain-containing protein [Deltaproteobacteria bacterium]
MLDPNLLRRIEKNAVALKITPEQFISTLELLKLGFPVPFIAKYRQEETGGLHEGPIFRIRDFNLKFERLNSKVDALITSLEERGLLTPELEERFLTADGMYQVDDLYLPYRSVQWCPAKLARAAGLMPLAMKILDQSPDKTLEELAKEALERGVRVKTVAEALAGARYLISEKIFFDLEVLEHCRTLFRNGYIYATPVEEKVRESGKDFDSLLVSEKVLKLASHRYYAMKMDERLGYVTVEIKCDEEAALKVINNLYLQDDCPSTAMVKEAINDSYRHLIVPYVVRQTQSYLLNKAQVDYAHNLAKNIRELVKAPPLRGMNVMAFNPSSTGGTRIVALNSKGEILDWGSIKPSGTYQEREVAKITIMEYLERYDIQAMAIGANNFHKQIIKFIKSIQDFPVSMPIVVINISGLYSYTNSHWTQQEMPDFDNNTRGCVTIGRRLIDPLTEYAKIDVSLLYMASSQHDLDQQSLNRLLSDVMCGSIADCGVDVNAATQGVLRHVPGLNENIAINIVRHREYFGPFRNRLQLLEVPDLDSHVFKCCAPYLTIRDGDNPLDRTKVHPEAYHVVNQMAKDLRVPVRQLLGNAKLLQKLDKVKYVDNTFQFHTIYGIIKDLSEHVDGDRRGSLHFLSEKEIDFATNISLKDLKPGMAVSGRVHNFIGYGAFVDIGYQDHALLHIREMTHNFITHPSQVLHVNQQVKCFIKNVDLSSRRIELTLKNNALNGIHDAVNHIGKDIDKNKLHTFRVTTGEGVENSRAVAISSPVGVKPNSHGEKLKNRLGTLFSDDQLQAMLDLANSGKENNPKAIAKDKQKEAKAAAAEFQADFHAKLKAVQEKEPNAQPAPVNAQAAPIKDSPDSLEEFQAEFQAELEAERQAAAQAAAADQAAAQASADAQSADQEDDLPDALHAAAQVSDRASAQAPQASKRKAPVPTVAQAALAAQVSKGDPDALANFQAEFQADLRAELEAESAAQAVDQVAPNLMDNFEAKFQAELQAELAAESAAQAAPGSPDNFEAEFQAELVADQAAADSQDNFEAEFQAQPQVEQTSHAQVGVGEGATVSFERLEENLAEKFEAQLQAEATLQAQMGAAQTGAAQTGAVQDDLLAEFEAKFSSEFPSETQPQAVNQGEPIPQAVNASLVQSPKKRENQEPVKSKAKSRAQTQAQTKAMAKAQAKFKAKSRTSAPAQSQPQTKPELTVQAQVERPAAQITAQAPSPVIQAPPVVTQAPPKIEVPSPVTQAPPAAAQAPSPITLAPPAAQAQGSNGDSQGSASFEDDADKGQKKTRRRSRNKNSQKLDDLGQDVKDMVAATNVTGKGDLTKFENTLISS